MSDFIQRNPVYFNVRIRKYEKKNSITKSLSGVIKSVYLILVSNYCHSHQTLGKCENEHCTYRLKARIPAALVWEVPSLVGVEQGFPAGEQSVINKIKLCMY